jgi:hypothetical protein
MTCLSKEYSAPNFLESEKDEKKELEEYKKLFSKIMNSDEKEVLTIIKDCKSKQIFIGYLRILNSIFLETGKCFEEKQNKGTTSNLNTILKDIEKSTQLPKNLNIDSKFKNNQILPKSKNINSNAIETANEHNFLDDQLFEFGSSTLYENPDIAKPDRRSIAPK